MVVTSAMALDSSRGARDRAGLSGLRCRGQPRTIEAGQIFFDDARKRSVTDGTRYIEPMPCARAVATRGARRLARCRPDLRRWRRRGMCRGRCGARHRREPRRAFTSRQARAQDARDRRDRHQRQDVVLRTSWPRHCRRASVMRPAASWAHAGNGFPGDLAPERRTPRPTPVIAVHRAARRPVRAQGARRGGHGSVSSHALRPGDGSRACAFRHRGVHEPDARTPGLSRRHAWTPTPRPRRKLFQVPGLAVRGDQRRRRVRSPSSSAAVRPRRCAHDRGTLQALPTAHHPALGDR